MTRRSVPFRAVKGHISLFLIPLRIHLNPPVLRDTQLKTVQCEKYIRDLLWQSVCRAIASLQGLSRSLLIRKVSKAIIYLFLLLCHFYWHFSKRCGPQWL